MRSRTTTRVRIEVHGECDLASARLLNAAIEHQLRAGRRIIHLDLSRVRFLDAAGLRALVEARNAALAEHGELILINPAPCIQRLLRITELDTVLSIRRVPGHQDLIPGQSPGSPTPSFDDDRARPHPNTAARVGRGHRLPALTPVPGPAPVAGRDTGSVREARLVELLHRLASADLAGDLSRELPTEQLLDRVLHRLITLLPGAQEVALALHDPDRIHATGPLAAACAARAGELRDQPSTALALGAGSLLCAALPSPGRSRGTLLCCSPHPDAFDTAAMQVLPLLAGRVAAAVVHTRTMQHMRATIEDRQIIAQACGMLIERDKLPPPQALETLGRISQRHHLTLRESAERLVAASQQPDDTR